MGKRELKTELNQFDKIKLINLVVELYDKFKPVKEYLDYFVKPEVKNLLPEYKNKVRQAFYPKRGYKLQLSIGKKAISDFRKFEPSPEELIELMIYYVECGVEFTNEFGDIDEHFYDSVESVYRNALNLVEKYGFHELFKDKATQICSDTENIGWGFNDALCDDYYEVYGENC